MNNKGKCVNSKCSRAGIEQLYTPMMLAGLGAGKDRVKCPECGELLRTIDTVDTGGRPHVRPVIPPRKPQRGHGRGQRGR
jgi:hypothetical protein